MCQFASFFHNPINGDVVVSVLDSHGETEKNLKLNNKVWREGHYLPNGEIVLRFNDDDRTYTHCRTEYETAFKNRFPSFISFLNWALPQVTKNGVYTGSLDLRALTSAKDLILPKTVSGYLDLRGLTSAKDLILPKTVSGSLDLSALTSAKDLVLPKKITGSLDLRALTSAKDLILPKTVSGYLDLKASVRAKLNQKARAKNNG